jgi:hypothetical protein
MNPSATDDRTDAFARLLQELRDDPTGTSGEWLARLVAEIRPRGPDGVPAAREHFRSLNRVVQARPEFAATLNAHLGALLTSRMHRILYAESGILTNPGFMSGLVRRLLGRLLPPAVDTEYLRDLVAEVFDHAGDYLWLSAVPREDWAALLDAIGVDGADFAPARRKCRHEALEAMRLDSVRLAALGTDTALLQYLPALARHESPFLAQMAEVRGFIEHHAEPSPSSPDDGHLEVLLCQCDEYVSTLRRRSREAGVGVNLVFLLARIEQILARLRELRDLLVPQAPGAEDEAHRREIEFFLRLVRQENRRNSVRDLFRGTTELLARRVTEQASRSGEHYITESRGEFFAMYRAAAGAGLIIAAMALVKILTAKLDLPPVWEAVAFSLNYGIGFVLIHVLHLTIATKQPAMTAATLAAELDGRPVPRLGSGGAGQGCTPSAGLTSLAQPRAAARGDRRRLSFPERAHLGLLRQPVAVPPRARATAPREANAQAARGTAARAALRLRRAQSRRAGGQLPVRLHAGLHAHRRRAARPAARHPSRRLLERQLRLRFERARVRGAGVDRRGQFRGRAVDRPGQSRRQLRARVEGRAALAWHHP